MERLRDKLIVIGRIIMCREFIVITKRKDNERFASNFEKSKDVYNTCAEVCLVFNGMEATVTTANKIINHAR